MSSAQAIFEPLSGDRTRLRCTICETEIAKTSKTSHVRTKKHILGLKDREAQSTSRSEPPPILPPLQFVTLSTVDHGAARNQALAHQKKDQDASEEFFHSSRVDEVGMFIDDDGVRVHFSAGENEDQCAAAEMQKLDEQLDYLGMIQDHTFLAQFEHEGDPPNDTRDDESPISRVTAAIDELCIEDEEEGDQPDVEMMDADQEPENSSDWWPYPSKQMFLLDMLDNMPRQRLSEDHLKSILWVMRESGTPSVPTLSALRTLQKKLAKQFALEPQPHTSSLGNHFYMNHPGKLFAMDWSNPLVRQHIRVYPEISSTVSETYQAAKWLEESSPTDLSPMWANWKSSADRHRHFYVDELTLSDSGYVIPLRWVSIANIVYADVLRVDFEDRTFSVRIRKVDDRIPALSLRRNLLDLQAGAGGDWNLTKIAEYSPTKFFKPNSLREIAKGRPLFCLRTVPWSDDVSGNVSKQYNAHTNIYATNGNLPHRLLAQEYFIRSCSTSSHASSSEQFVAFTEDLKENVWHEAYDCELEEDILFQIIAHFLPADNPQQSETSSHIGVNGSLNCRRDLTGGSDAHKETDEGYKSLYSPGDDRECEQTIQCIRWQVWLACLGKPKAVEQAQTQSGVKDKIAQHWIELVLQRAKNLEEYRIKDPQTRDPRLNSSSLKGDARKELVGALKSTMQTELWDWVIQQPSEAYAKLANDDPGRHDLRAGDHFNALLVLRGIDPHRDTPGEILHTYLLGNDKYVWHDTSKTWSKENERTFAVRLDSCDILGLSIPPPRASYLVQYKNSLIGKHFKALQQLAATGDLAAYLWFPEINDMNCYLKDLQVLIDNLLDAWAVVDPRRILTKIKLHVLTHLPEDIRRLGPAVIFATEVFECFNAVFRMCSIFSNHLAPTPSRDISTDLGQMERFKHIASGGYWKAETGYVRAGPKVISFLEQNVQFQRRLGWTDPDLIKPGLVKRFGRDKRNSSTWSSHVEGLRLGASVAASTSLWDECSVVVAVSQDLCRAKSWVFFKGSDKSTLTGRIIKILMRSGKTSESTQAQVLIEQFRIAEHRDTRLNMPILIRTEERTVHIVSPVDILFDFNTQHDCVSGACVIGDSTEYIRQERKATDTLKQCIIHTDTGRYHLNMHGLHNAHLIRKALPYDLVKPIPLQADRAVFHKNMARLLQISGPQKRAETQEKTRATKERNKRAKEAREAGGTT
ncbi:hypothetical protein BDZ89DRAFT_1166951 [Hymenopellis radicata]|nr:hypothetical protein BDZ89DRAFT_1166951 [Hymenopellis radicata]